MVSNWFDEMEKAEQEYDIMEYEVELSYNKGYKEGRADAIDEYKMKIDNMIKNDEAFDYCQFEILKCNELIAGHLKECNNG